jgi:pimeloyl-ACP methyl ester carboxylesterase
MNKVVLSYLFVLAVLAACNMPSAKVPITAPNYVQVIGNIRLGSNSDSTLLDLQTRPGVAQRILLKQPKEPQASLILFAGGHGNLAISDDGGIGWGQNNFLVRSRNLFVDRGFVVALMDAPLNRKHERGMSYGFRASPEHAQDIRKIISYLRKQFPGPVWLVGTSRGSASAANAAIRITQDGPDGLVLTSSITRRNEKGDNLLDMALEDIRVPTLVVHHKEDGCRVTPHRAVRDIMKRLTNSSEAEQISFTGGKAPVSRPCGARSRHGFYGIEEEVVENISKWIKRHL